ncbi:MAG: hypothetical protein H7281_17235 [Bacteriovorax sp.]|nr:hypothetical protein [Bacteriovorax sp.]
MSNEDTLISKLIEETCTESVEKDQPNTSIDLRKYFEKRLNQVDFNSISDYLDQHHLSHQALIFETHSGCYRLNFKQSILDFPSNWSIFKEISSSDLLYVDQSLDQDFLLDIFAELCGSFQNIALVKENQEIQLVFLPDEESRDHVKWMKEYFEKKNISTGNEEKIAA